MKKKTTKGPSAKQKAVRAKFAKMNQLAQKSIIDAAKQGKKIPTRKAALRAAAKKVYK